MNFKSIASFTSLAILMSSLSAQPKFVASGTNYQPLIFNIPMAPTLLIVKEDPIASVMVDTQKFQVETNDDAGQVFLTPIGEVDDVVYITTRSGELILARLVVKAGTAVRPIVIERKEEETPKEVASRNLISYSEDSYPKQIKRFVRDCLGGKDNAFVIQSAPRVSRTVEHLMTELSSLSPRVSRYWESKQFVGTELVLKNVGLERMKLNLTSLTTREVLALAVTDGELEPGQVVKALVVEEALE